MSVLLSTARTGCPVPLYPSARETVKCEAVVTTLETKSRLATMVTQVSVNGHPPL